MDNTVAVKELEAVQEVSEDCFDLLLGESLRLRISPIIFHLRGVENRSQAGTHGLENEARMPAIWALVHK